MTQDMWITLFILLAAIVLFVTEWLRVDVVALGVMVALMLTGILTTSEAIAGFSSTSVLLIASLFIVGGAVFQTGLAASIGNQILKIAGDNETRLITVVMATVAIMSGFMSDTGVVAVMMPAIISLAISAKLNPSKLLIPLAMGSLLGGASTLIGTPPNIIVSELLATEAANGTMIGGKAIESFSFFSYTPLAIFLILAGIFFMTTIGRRLLPDRRAKQVVQQVETPAELLEVYRLPDNLFRLRVRSKSPLVGQHMEDTEFGKKFDISVLEIARARAPRTVARIGGQRLVLQSGEAQHIHPEASTVLERDDILIVKGEGNEIGKAAAFWGLAIQPATITDTEALISHEVGVAEVVLPPRSSLIGKTLVDVRFGSTYHLTVLDMKRADTDEKLDLKTTRLQFGDTLLVQGEWKEIFELKNKRRDFVVMGESEDISLMQNKRKAPTALAVLMGMLFLLVFGESIGISGTTGTMIAALAVVLTGCLTMDEAYDAIDWKSLVLIAGMLPMSTALVKVGLVDWIVTNFTTMLGGLDPSTAALISMGGLFLLTSGLTQVLSNTATAVLIAPIAFATAVTLDVQPYALMMAVAVAASMAFMSPVASPVNTLVMGAGNYKFGDYVKTGFPMAVIMFIVSMIALPILFPF